MSRVVLITGTSTGFGRAATEMLVERGYRVFATMRDSSGRNAPHRDALLSLPRPNTNSIEVLDLDVTDEKSVNDAVQKILDTAGRIDVVINNAGIGALGITEAYTIDQYRQVFDVNLLGVARVNRAVLPAMRNQRSGLLIHVSSGAGRGVLPSMAVYCASKFALEALAEAYRMELSPFGIDSVIVEPGIHRTPILENFMAPADTARVAQYGDAGDYAARVKSVFDAASASPETPDATPVAQAFLQLIETPAGQRQFRTVPTAAMQPLLSAYNAAAEEIRSNIAHAFGVPDLLVLKQAASTGA